MEQEWVKYSIWSEVGNHQNSEHGVQGVWFSVANNKKIFQLYTGHFN